MAGHLRILGFVLALAVGTAAAQGGTYYENFASDPGWSGLNNTVAPQNYGFAGSGSDVTGSVVLPPGGTASGGGEMGGTIRRDASPANFYAYAVPTALNATDTFHADGVVHLVSRQGGSGYFLGFFSGAGSYGSGGDPLNFAGINWGDTQNAQAMIFSNTGGRDRSGVDPAIPTGTTVPWSIDWVAGSMTISVNGVSQGPISSGGTIDPFTHFGIFAISADGDLGTVFYDDITLTGPGFFQVPEPTSLALLPFAAVAALRRRRHA